MYFKPMTDVMAAIGDDQLSTFDEILRAGHQKFCKSISSDARKELDSRAQAASTYCHIVAEAERRFDGQKKIRFIDIGGLKLWLFEDSDTVVSFKKMSKNGKISSYGTKQQQNFDAQLPLEGLPIPPTRLRVGYLLDPLGADFVRSQIASPNKKNVLWCAAIQPPEDRVVGQSIWYDAAERRSLVA